jgi:hypothetical protein
LTIKLFEDGPDGKKKKKPPAPPKTEEKAETTEVKGDAQEKDESKPEIKTGESKNPLHTGDSSTISAAAAVEGPDTGVGILAAKKAVPAAPAAPAAKKPAATDEPPAPKPQTRTDQVSFIICYKISMLSFLIIPGWREDKSKRQEEEGGGRRTHTTS